MNKDEIKELELAISKAKFTLSQKAGELHDLIEDRLPADYTEIPAYAEATYRACLKWDELTRQLVNLKK